MLFAQKVEPLRVFDPQEVKPRLSLNSKVVEHSTNYPKFQGSNPAIMDE
jgi:hypothetical protein